MLNTFIKVYDDDVVVQLKDYGFTPFSQSGGVFTFAKSDKLVKLLNSKFDISQFCISNKLTF